MCLGDFKLFWVHFLKILEKHLVFSINFCAMALIFEKISNSFGKKVEDNSINMTLNIYNYI